MIMYIEIIETLTKIVFLLHTHIIRNDAVILTKDVYYMV